MANWQAHAVSVHMPFISATRLGMRSVRFLPLFVMGFLRTCRQVRNARGFQGRSFLADRAWTLWSVTA